MGSRKRNKAEELKDLNKNRVFAKLNNCPTSPRKMRLVADQVRGKKVDKALSILKFSLLLNLIALRLLTGSSENRFIGSPIDTIFLFCICAMPEL